ncbi:protein-tyrosine phosphatase-like protein [Mycena filopes]|nr:protein-tyrosine phosphatase-like protein [Mycena filopes]
MGKRDKGSAQPAASLIYPSIYLGPCSAASSKPFLSVNSITHVLSVGATPKENVDGIVYHRISITDSPSSAISKVCEEACAFIDTALGSKNKDKNETGKILVHCSAGISRSPMIVAAYLMKRRGMSLRAALGQIVRARPQVVPNAGFIGQLKELELELLGTASLDVDELPRREQDRLALFTEGD